MTSKLEQEFLGPMTKILGDLVVFDSETSEGDDHLPKHFAEVSVEISKCGKVFVDVAANMSKKTKSAELMNVLTQAVVDVRDGDVECRSGLSKPSRKVFIDGVFKMVEGARAVLHCLDQTEIEKLIHACSFSLQTTDDFLTFTSEEIKANAPVLESNYQLTCKHARARVEELLNHDFREGIMKNVLIIEAVCPKFLEAIITKTKDSNFSGVVAEEERIKEALNEIIIIAKSVPGVDNYDKKVGDLWNFMKAIAARLLTYNFDEEGLKKFRKDALALIDNTEKFIPKCNDDLLKHRLERDLQHLKDALTEMEKAEFAYIKCEDPEKKTELQEELKGKFGGAQVCAAKLASNLGKLLTGIKSDPEAVALVRHAAAEMIAAAKHGDRVKFERYKKELDQEFEELMKQIKKAIDTTNDDALKKELMNLANKLPATKEKLIEAARKVLLDPTPENLLALKKTEDEWNSLLDEARDLLERATPLSDRLKEAKGRIERLGAHVVDGYKKGNHQMAGRATNGIENEVSQIQKWLDDEATNDDDKAYIQKLIDMSDNLGLQMENTQTSVIDGASKPVTNEHANIIKGNIQKLVDSVDLLADEASQREKERLAEEKRKAEEEARRLALLAEEERKRQEEERRAAEEAEKLRLEALRAMERPDDAIKAAAYDIKQEASILGDNEMVAATLEIARLLEILADAAKEGDKKKIIETCKLIEKYSKIVHKHATVISDGCKDKRLQNSLKVESNALITITSQLRVIALVKCSSLAEQNSESYQQLVVCAQNLSNSVTKTVQQSEVASLRLNEVDKATSGLKWRRGLSNFY